MTNNKASCIIIVGLVALGAFFLGVKYSESVKNHASWMFESKEDIALPDLSNEEIDGANVNDQQDVLANPNGTSKEVQAAGEMAAPMESHDESANSAKIK